MKLELISPMDLTFQNCISLPIDLLSEVYMNLILVSLNIT